MIATNNYENNDSQSTYEYIFTSLKRLSGAGALPGMEKVSVMALACFV
jgi:hypothetical protein